MSNWGGNRLKLLCWLFPAFLPVVWAVSAEAKPKALITLRWAGTAKVSSDTNSSLVFEVAALPESIRLKEQTIRKLACAPWVLSHTPIDTNTSALLKPMIEQVLKGGCLLTLASVEGAPATLLAARVPADQTAKWEADLALVAEMFARKKPTPLPGDRIGWISGPIHSDGRKAPNEEADRRSQSFSILFTQIKDWTVVGSAPDLAVFDAVLAGSPI